MRKQPWKRPREQHGRAALGLLLLGLLATTSAAWGADPPERRDPAAKTTPSRRPSAVLAEAWPDHPEWLAMLADILALGNRLDGESGWFRKAVAQTRFGWDATRGSLDKDGDGAVSRGEFPGVDADFARLDRDRDGSLGPLDFDFASRPQSPSPGALLFARADRNGNGKVTREELSAFFESVDPDGLGFVSLADLQQAFAQPALGLRGSIDGPGAPTRWMLVRSLFLQELGSLQPGPALGEVAPDFTLKTVDGEPITFSTLLGPKPVVLVFGNVSCSPFRSQSGILEKFHHRYKDRATFLMVYVREAHPTDGWRMESNDRVGVTPRQPRTNGERLEVAQFCSQTLQLSFPMLVDTIDDAVGGRYSGMPGRFYLIDRNGKVAYKSGRGPFGFKLAELEHSLILLLAQEVVASSPDSGRRDHSPSSSNAPRAK